MTNNQILRIALPTPLVRLFDYLVPEGVDVKTLVPGMRVRVPFQSRKLIGVLVEMAEKSEFPINKLKSALEILDQKSIFTSDIYQLCQWAANYYHYSLGEVLMAALPTLLRKGAAPDEGKSKVLLGKQQLDDPPVLNVEQASALKAITHDINQFRIFLLDGVTGSGKTEVYLQTISHVLAAGKQILVLVPEISLTPQTIARFRDRFCEEIVALHSSLTEKQRLYGWQQASTGKAKIVIGTRSAIFTAFESLGLIILDEEHDSSFKQQDRFRYHARDLAVMRASMLKIPVILGSATPSLESILNVQRDRYTQLLLRERAGGAQLPNYQLIDLRKQEVEEGFSAPLLQAMRTHLENNNQVMLFLNRRGFAPVLYCKQCAWIAECKRCDARMIYHRMPPRLQCHHCDARRMIPKECGVCKTQSLEPVGLGTQRLENTLRKHFPDMPIMRIDRDTTRKKGALNDLLAQINLAQPAILLGTQMLAKGHHFPQVTLVGVVDADSGLFSVDYRAAEQMGQLLLQVSGRAGRADKAGTVMIQTRHPEHPLLQTLLHQGYPAFSQVLLQERQKAHLPPYSYFAVVRAEAFAEEGVQDFLFKVKTITLEQQFEINILGPVPALIARRKGLYCKHLIIKANQRNQLQQFLKSTLPKIEKIPNQHGIKWVLDVDPIEV